MKKEVIDNFLDEEYFDSLVKLITYKGSVNTNTQWPWYLTNKITKNHDHNLNNLFYMTHLIYLDNEPISHFYGEFFPFLEKLGSVSNTYRPIPHTFATRQSGNIPGLIRIKANLFPNTEILHEHEMHTDYSFSHNAAVFSLNTCNGYTKLEDGTKVDSVANRLLLFDASEKHCSTTTTNDIARFNININFY